MMLQLSEAMITASIRPSTKQEVESALGLHPLMGAIQRQVQRIVSTTTA